MCGIAGRINLTSNRDPISVELLSGMIKEVHHRGPDEYGYYRDESAGLAHARLSIIDINSGQQPIHNEDQTLWIVFNGEIFNYIELREELLGWGHRFRTGSDTEVIVHAYEQWGKSCFERFNGQWALALWDSKQKKLVLCRDRVGVRPLYVREENEVVWFASEIKSIFADPSVSREINPAGLGQTFTYWSSIAPTTVFKGIEELLPGSMRIYQSGKQMEEHIYWYPSFPVRTPEQLREPNRMTLREATETLESKLMNAAKLRMLRSDVPVGSYLSGGIDSSLIAWLGRRWKEGEFRTFSIRFADAEFDETRFQRKMASVLESKHEEITVKRADIADVFPDVVRHTERPVLRTAPAPLFILSKLVRESGFKVVLTGEGADEMLAGYDIFREAKIRRFMALDPDSKIRPALFDRLYPYLARSPQKTKGMAIEFWKKGLNRIDSPAFSHEPRWDTTSALKKFLSDEMQNIVKPSPRPYFLENLPEEFKSWDPLAQAQYLEIMSLFASYIISSQGDRMLMANSVEGRFPFLDAEVMEFCNILPAEYKLIGLDEKNILKRVARGKVPDEIIERKKQPYRAPDAVSFVTGKIPGYVDEMFSERMINESGLFSVKTVRGLYLKCLDIARKESGEYNFSNNDNMGFIGILSAQLLHYQYVRGGHAFDDTQVHYTTVFDRLN